MGPNGSGKSTLLRCLAGTLPYSGTVRLGAEVVDALPEFRRVRAGIARTFQRTAVMPHLGLREHVEVGLRVGYQHAGWAQALFRTPAYRAEVAAGRLRAVAILAGFGLADNVDTRPDALSGGRQRLLQIATAAATAPRALLLDEPAAGMDRDELALLERALQGIAAEGTAVLLIEHNMGFLARIAEKVTVLEAGRVLAEGTSAQVAANPEVRRAYLGPSVPRPHPRRVHRGGAAQGQRHDDHQWLAPHRGRPGDWGRRRAPPDSRMKSYLTLTGPGPGRPSGCASSPMRWMLAMPSWANRVSAARSERFARWAAQVPPPGE